MTTHLDVDPPPAPTDRARRALALTHRPGSARVVGVLGVAAVVLVTVLWVADHLWIDPGTPTVDVRGVDLITAQRTAATIAFARVATHLGDLWVVALIATVLVVLARRRSGRWDAAQLVALAVGGVLVVTAVAKELTARLRPDEALTSTVSLAFPSGHASRATVVYLLVAWLVMRWARHRIVGVAVAAVAVTMVVATAWSRVLLGAHWPSDVLAGSLLGATWLALVLVATRPASVPITHPTPGHHDQPATG